MKDEHEELRLK